MYEATDQIKDNRLRIKFAMMHCLELIVLLTCSIIGPNGKTIFHHPNDPSIIIAFQSFVEHEPISMRASLSSQAVWGVKT